MRRLLRARRHGEAEPPPPRSPESQWFWDHYETAAGEIVGAAASAGVDLEGLRVADVGCGDGIMALGVCHKARPADLVAFDVNLTDEDHLLRQTRTEEVGGELPAQLSFRRSSPTSTPAQDEEFDFVYSWSAFEHIAEPISVLSEIRRIIRPSGCFFLQLWPFYLSARGSHLWDWFPDEFHHLRQNHRDAVDEMLASDRHTPEWTRYMGEEYERLNRVTLDELQRAVLVSGFDVRRLELITMPTIVTPDLARFSWTDLAVSGIKLVATPRA